MQQKKMYALVSVLLIILIVTACSAPPVPPTSTQSIETAQVTATVPAAEETPTAATESLHEPLLSCPPGRHVDL